MRNLFQNRVAVKVSSVVIAATALMLSACMVGPNYHRPVVQTPTSSAGLTNPNKRKHKPHHSPMNPGGKCSTTLNCNNLFAQR
jgi:hypothetical protein